jgi:putative nucleotidyltransferase with HDIG domain
MSASKDLAALIASSEPMTEVAAALAGAPESWFVGGAVRDLLLERPIGDVDLAVSGDAKQVAKALNEHFGGDIFSLSDRFGTWRVMPAKRDWRIDLTALRGTTIADDLALRDFTVNAMAIAATGEPTLIDPFGGVGDLESQTLRVLGEQAYAEDPLRPLRLARLSATLGFSPDTATADLTRAFAARVTEAAPERVFAELNDLIRAPGVLRGLDLLDQLGLMAVLLPELAALQGVEQSVYHHLDAYGHTLEVLERLIEIEDSPSEIFGDDADALVAELATPLADEMTRGEALRWGALLHDIAKSETRIVAPDGRVGFPGHDRRGAEIVRSVCSRLHTSERFSQYVAALTRHHLRLGFLVREAPLSRRQVYQYLRACEPVEVEVGVLSVADRTATRGRKADDAIASHLRLARELNREALAWRAAGQPEALIRGDVLASALGIRPGPQLGELLAEIAEERFAGEITTADQAIAYAKTRVSAPAE